MSNNPFGGPPQPSGWGPGPAQPSAPGAHAQQHQQPGRGRRRVVVGCAVIVLGLASACGFGIWWAFDRAQDAREVLQAQATALGRNDALAVCRHNTSELNTRMNCGNYVAWLNTFAPYFAGGRVTIQGFDAQSAFGAGASIQVPVSVAGPRGSGNLSFRLVRVDDEWMVDSVQQQ